MRREYPSTLPRRAALASKLNAYGAMLEGSSHDWHPKGSPGTTLFASATFRHAICSDSSSLEQSPPLSCNAGAYYIFDKLKVSCQRPPSSSSGFGRFR